MLITPASNSWMVLKFGGTSVSQRHRWETIGKLALRRQQEEQARILVVVSALSGITNLLQAIVEGQADAASLYTQIYQRHHDFTHALELDFDSVLGQRMQDLSDLVSNARPESLRWQAEVLAQGELMSSTLGVAYLQTQNVPFQWLDARDWLDAIALPNQNEWSQHLSVSCQREWQEERTRAFLSQPGSLFLTQGFISRHRDGGTAILGRGGSDTSAAYFGALLNAKRVEIWTDVPGMFSANPKEVPDARLLTRLDYAEAQEIATTGAKVLHPRAIKPCRDANVPIMILDTERPDLPGTRIDGSAAIVPGVKAISRRNGVVLISMEGMGMWQQVGFLADIFERFKRHGLSVDLIGSSETNVTVSLDPSENLVSSNILEALSSDLAEVCRVKVILPCAAITLVGRGMRSLLYKLSDVWATFGRERVHLISQSSNDLNLTFVIDEADADGLMAVLHAELIESNAMPIQDSNVFGPSWKIITEGQPDRRFAWWEQHTSALLTLAQQHTPHYVYSLDKIRQQADALKLVDAIDQYFYAIKANSNPEILRYLHAMGFGLECVSLSEINYAKTHVPNLQSGDILFTPSFAPWKEYQAALESGVTVTLDNVEALQQQPAIFRNRRLWLRLDLGRGDGHHEKVITGGVSSKFGLPLSRLDSFLKEARALDITIVGLHAHLGSGIDRPAHWRDVYVELASIADSIGTVESIDIGGGLPIPYKPDDVEFDVQSWSNALHEIKTLYPQYKLVVEPGRYLVAESGVLLTQVTQVVEKSGVRRIGLDAGMNALMRPALYEAWHQIHNISQLEAEEMGVFDVVGPICESGDVLGTRRQLPEHTRVGDVMLIADAGAYGMTMANTYNQRELPAETVLHGVDDV